MGLFSRRRTKGFDPELWSDAKERSAAGAPRPWTEDDADGLDAIATNAGARFDEADQEWLTDDPGEAIRRRKQ